MNKYMFIILNCTLVNQYKYNFGKNFENHDEF